MKKAILSIVLALSAPALFADDLKGKTELNVFGGLNHFNDGGGNHGIYGASLGRGVSNHVLVFGEFAHTPLDGGNLVDYMGGLKLNIGTSEKFVPYALVGFGAGRFSNDLFSDTDATLHLGVGGRWYASPKWGVVPEVRWVRYFSEGNDGNAVRVTGGVFFQW